MTKIAGVADRSDAKPGMAFFAGTGPFAESCGTCRHRGYMRKGRRNTACAMYFKLTGRHGVSVSEYYQACKYFTPK
jgi:hypothetical protein